MQAVLDRIADSEGFIYDPFLVLYLPLHQLDGSPFMSRDAYGHLCTVTGALWTPRGRDFDGIDDEIGCGDIDELDGLTAITMEAWVNYDGTLSTAAVVLRKELVFILGGGWVEGKAVAYINDGTWRGSGSGTTDIDDGSFWHLTGVYDGVKMRIYVNAIEESSAAFASLTMASNANIVNIGATKATPSTSLWKGVIGEVRIYSRALSPLEIQRNYLSTKWRYR
jgi:hypothetical protein